VITLPEPEGSRSGGGHSRVHLIAALGSSFAAGPGIDPIVDAGAMRSGSNYAHLLAKAIGARLVDLTVSGATTANILNTPQQTLTGEDYPPQIVGVPANADLVTITAGGNDLRFIGSMLFAAWSKADPNGWITQLLAENIADAIPQLHGSEVSAVAEGLVHIVSAVRQAASGARTILVDYLTVVTERTPTGSDEPFTADELSGLLRVQECLAEAYRMAATRAGVELLAVSDMSRDHGIGSTQPWVFGFQSDIENTMASFHPNRDGMQAVADKLAEMLIV
jgi:lysophospholipase L1-like esterase